MLECLGPRTPLNAYLRVIGIDALAEELRTRGADIVDGPEDRSYGQRELTAMV
jgi:hypothetical protein